MITTLLYNTYSHLAVVVAQAYGEGVYGTELYSEGEAATTPAPGAVDGGAGAGTLLGPNSEWLIIGAVGVAIVLILVGAYLAFRKFRRGKNTVDA